MKAPTKTIVRSQHYPSSLIPFPAVTVCPPNKISTRKVKAFLRPFLQYYRQAMNTSSDEKAILRATSQMNDPMEYNLASHEDMEQLDKVPAVWVFVGVSGDCWNENSTIHNIMVKRGCKWLLNVIAFTNAGQFGFCSRESYVVAEQRNGTELMVAI